jgi:AbrB family looped-hinge helix DNA binding protein
MARSRLSTKGQVVVPKEVREAHAWLPGTVLEFEERGEGVLIRSATRFRRTRVEDLLGCLAWRGPAKTLEEMEAGIAQGARESSEQSR